MKNVFLARRSFVFVSLISAALWLHTSQTASAVVGTVYDVNANWSNTQNPNGAWSYNQNTTPIGVFQTFNFAPGQAGWGYLNLADGAIFKAGAIAGAHDWQAGDVMMHALSEPYGGLGTFVNVTWTSPGAGLIDIGGRAWDGQINADRDVSWSLIVGGQTIAQRSSTIGLFRTDASAQLGANLLPGYSLTGIPVAAGDVVEFQVKANTYYGQFVGIEQTITFVPEPGASQLLLVGLAGLWAVRKYTRRASVA